MTCPGPVAKQGVDKNTCTRKQIHLLSAGLDINQRGGNSLSLLPVCVEVLVKKKLQQMMEKKRGRVGHLF